MKTFNYNRLFLLCSIIFLSYFQIGSSYTITGNVLTDLTATDADFFNQASTWTASNYATAGVVVSMCDDTFLVGGYNVLGPAGANQNGNYFEQTYTSLPTHNNMYFSIRLWMIDGWDIWSDYVQIYFDNNQYGTFYFRKEDAVTPNICGATAKNEIPGATLEGQLPHSSASLNLRFYMRTSKDSMSASFGFRDIKLTFDTIYPPATGITYCTRSPTYLYYGTRCTCKTTQFESPSNSGSCVNCDATCATCYGSAATNCYSCYPGTYFSNYRCLTCDGSCKTCSASGTSSCTACAPGKFLTNTPTGACSSCDSTCTTCTGTATTCTSCPAGRYQSGNTCPQCHTSCATCTGDKAYQCVTCPTGSYLANNNTCITSCDSPFIKTTDGTINFCESPCTNLANFAYWDKSCQTTCAFPLSPLTLGPFKYCNYTCATSEYLYWNGTCGSRCPLPWKIDVKFVRNFCTFPCSTTQFLFANGTCANSCPYPLVTRPGETGQKYCDYPCSSTEYLLWNQTCATSCASPYQIKISGDIRYCNYPCDTTQYYYWNGSCYSKACAAPLTLRTEGGTTPSNIRNFCDLNCAKNQYMLWNGSCSNSCNSPLRAVESNGLRYCKAPCDDAYPFYFEDLAACGQSCTSPRYVEQEANYNYSLCIKPAVEDKGGSLTYFMLNAPQVNEYSLVVPTAGMGYLRFLNVNLPSRLEKLAGSQGKFLFTPRFGLSAPDSLKASFSRLLMDEVLERNGMHKSFILNFWDGLLTLAIVLGITLVLTILENVLQKSKGFLKGIHGVVERLMVMGGFNYVILVYASSIGEIVTYTYIEVTNYTSISASLIIGVLMTILIIPFFVGIVIVMKRAVKFNAYTLKNETADKYKKFAIKWRACQIFIRGMKHDHVLSRLFFLIYTVRINIQMIIGVFLMSIPIASSVIQIVINVAMIVFMLWKRPLQKKVNIVQILVFEAITLLLNICVFIVVVVCSSGTCEDGIAVIIGDVIVIGSDILNILVIVFLAIKIAIEANSIRNFLKEYPTHSKAVWTNLVSVLAQQTGMGFEECIEESSIPESSNKYIGLVLRTNTMIAREQAELLRSKSRSQIFPEDMEKRAINDTEPMIRKTDISNPMIAVNSTVLTNTADMTQIPPQSPPKLKARVKNVINNLSLKKSGTGAESHLNPLNGSPTFSIDLSDNSPAIPEVGLQEGPLLLKQAPSIESPSPIPRPSEGNNVFFPNDNIFQSSRPVSNYDDKRLLNITPIVATDTLTLDSSIDKKPTKVADEVGLDDYLKQFGLLSDDQNKASATANRKNLNRSPTLKSKKK